VVGQAFVFLFAPVVAYVGILVKGLIVYELVFKTVLGLKCHDCLSLRFGLKDSFFNMFAGISSPALVSNDFENKPKEKLRKYYALNRIVVSTILFIEIAVTLALIVSVGKFKNETSESWIKSIFEGKFENVTIESMIRMPGEIREDLNCTNVCEGGVMCVVVKENKTATKNESTRLTDVTSLFKDMMMTEKQEECYHYVPIVERDFYILAVTLMILASYTIIESVIMLCGNHSTPSDWLLWDQKDRPDKVSL